MTASKISGKDDWPIGNLVSASQRVSVIAEATPKRAPKTVMICIEIMFMGPFGGC